MTLTPVPSVDEPKCTAIGMMLTSKWIWCVSPSDWFLQFTYFISPQLRYGSKTRHEELHEKIEKLEQKLDDMETRQRYRNREIDQQSTPSSIVSEKSLKACEFLFSPLDKVLTIFSDWHLTTSGWYGTSAHFLGASITSTLYAEYSPNSSKYNRADTVDFPLSILAPIAGDTSW